MDRIVIGIFDDYGVTEKAIDELMCAGVSSGSISVLGSSEKHASSLSTEIYPKHVPEELAKFTAAGAIGGGLIALVSNIAGHRCNFCRGSFTRSLKWSRCWFLCRFFSRCSYSYGYR